MVGDENPLSLRRPQTLIKLSTRLKLVNLVNGRLASPWLCLPRSSKLCSRKHLPPTPHPPEGLFSCTVGTSPTPLRNAEIIFFSTETVFSLLAPQTVVIFTTFMSGKYGKVSITFKCLENKKSLFLLIFLRVYLDSTNWNISCNI